MVKIKRGESLFYVAQAPEITFSKCFLLRFHKIWFVSPLCKEYCSQIKLGRWWVWLFQMAKRKWTVVDFCYLGLKKTRISKTHNCYWCKKGWRSEVMKFPFTAEQNIFTWITSYGTTESQNDASVYFLALNEEISNGWFSFQMLHRILLLVMTNLGFVFQFWISVWLLWGHSSEDLQALCNLLITSFKRGHSFIHNELAAAFTLSTLNPICK
jgi:hypothetical protein